MKKIRILKDGQWYDWREYTDIEAKVEVSRDIQQLEKSGWRVQLVDAGPDVNQTAEYRALEKAYAVFINPKSSQYEASQALAIIARYKG